MRAVGSIVAIALLASTAALAQPAPYPADWDKRLGDDFWTRLINYYALEWGHDGAPPDPTALPGRRAGWPPAPASTPPYPYTEWPYGGATSIGVTRPNSVDSPLMVALANTELSRKRFEPRRIPVVIWTGEDQMQRPGIQAGTCAHPGNSRERADQQITAFLRMNPAKK